MTIANYFVAEMKANPEKQKILISFKRIPTAKERKAYEVRRKERKTMSGMASHFAHLTFSDPYGETDSNFDLAFPTMFMILRVKEVQKRKLTIGSVVAFNVPEDSTDILKPLKINE